MKLSNKVLIGFFGFILVYMLAAFTEVRLKGDFNRFDASRAKMESVEIDAVSHLVLSDVKQRIIVNTSDKPRIELSSTSGTLLSKLNYQITGDTLVVKELPMEKHEQVKFVIYVPQSGLNGIDVDGAGVKIRNLNQSALSITQSAGTVNIEGNNRLKNLKLTATNDARFDATGFDIDELSVQIDNSVVKVWAVVNRLEGRMNNNSHLVVQSPNDIQLKRDNTSRLQLSN